MRRSLAAALIAMLPTLLPAVVKGQATGTISGLVSDQSDSALPGVTVEVTSAATNQTRRAISATDGFYTVPLLQPGKYRVKATLPGFQTTVREDVQVSVESTARLDLRLAVASLEETITIIDEPPLIETSSS